MSFRFCWFRLASLLVGLFAASGIFLASALPSVADNSDYATTGKRVALVIGNGAYVAVPRLDNPASDAKAVSAALKRLGFDVTEGYDLTAAQLRVAVQAFSDNLTGAQAAVVYYAGHGVSVDGENYLLPTDFVLKSPADLDFNSVSLSLILRQMQREERVSVVILDACRDNPFKVELSRTRTRSVIGARGLASVEGDLAHGSLIAFASDPGKAALDGAPGEHSPFTEALLAHIEDPGVSIDTVMQRVRADVWKQTKFKQLPWVNTSLIGEFDFNPIPMTPIVSAEPASGTLAEGRKLLVDDGWCPHDQIKEIVGGSLSIARTRRCVPRP